LSCRRIDELEKALRSARTFIQDHEADLGPFSLVMADWCDKALDKSDDRLELAYCCGTCHFFKRYKDTKLTWLGRLLRRGEPPEISWTCENPKREDKDKGTHPELVCSLWEYPERKENELQPRGDQIQSSV
jgi:hypothetical protein